MRGGVGALYSPLPVLLTVFEPPTSMPNRALHPQNRPPLCPNHLNRFALMPTDLPPLSDSAAVEILDFPHELVVASRPNTSARSTASTTTSATSASSHHHQPDCLPDHRDT